MEYSIICSQGRVGDKTNSTLEGAKLTAELLETKFGVKAKFIGKPSKAKDDTWEESLPEAAFTLNSLQNELKNSIGSVDTNLLILNTCSASLATLPIVVEKYPDIKILWIDAHADFNTPDTTETGYLGGMVLGAVCGLWESGYGCNVDTKKVAIIGVHDIDSEEQKNIEKNGVKTFPLEKISPTKIGRYVGDSDVWIHIDWDVLEPGQINADYKISGGLDLAQLISCLSTIPRNQIKGLELAEFSALENFQSNQNSLNNILSFVTALFKV